jgi:hypothetical protein
VTPALVHAVTVTGTSTKRDPAAPSIRPGAPIVSRDESVPANPAAKASYV